jgi:uracil-DNA glycosylase
MSRPIPGRDLDRAFIEFCWPQIEVVQPKVVVCLGASVYGTFARNLLLPRSRGVGDSASFGGRLIWHQFHPAARASTMNMAFAWREMQNASQLRLK